MSHDPPAPPFELGRELSMHPSQHPAASSPPTPTADVEGDTAQDGRSADPQARSNGEDNERPGSRHSSTSSSSSGGSRSSAGESSEDNDNGPQTPTEGDDDEQSGVSYLAKELRTQHELLEKRGLPPFRPPLALALDHLSVRGAGGSGLSFAPTVGSSFAPWSGLLDKRRGKKLEKATGQDGAEKGEGEKGGKEEGKYGQEKLKKGQRFLVHDVSLLLKPSELLLVVGRPGSGCTTLLKALAGLTTGFAGVDGQVKYGSLDGLKGNEMRPWKAAVCFNSEDDVHFPNLSVKNTLGFALAQKTPSPAARPAAAPDSDAPLSEKAFNATGMQRLLKVLGLEHTVDTPVGDAYVQGVSGGEKKRVSIAEVLTNRASIQAWDNATRGLDANTALSFTKVLRTYADLEGLAAAVSLYQAGNGIYDQFDKVLVLAEGQVIFYGRRDEAKGYMEELGFEYQEGANVADFLTATTSEKERRVRDGFSGKVPTTAAAMAARYRSSDVAKRMRDELDAHLSAMDEVEKETQKTLESIQMEKHKGAIKREPHVRGLVAQTLIALKRESQQRWGDKWTFWARQGTTFIQAWVIASLFYNMQTDSSALFLRGGVLYLSLLFPSLISLSETTNSFEGRGILAKHKGFSLYRPSAIFFAQTLADLPVFAVQTILFTLIIWSMTHLKREAGSYFLLLLFTFTSQVCTTAFFRLVGASFTTFQNASKVSGFMFSVWVTYAGYVIQTPQMKVWFSWIRWIDPIYYAFEAVMANEMTGVPFTCAQEMTVPSGPGYSTEQNVGCAMAGSEPGSLIVQGTTYLDRSLAFGYKHVWRNFGILIGFWVGFCVLNAIAVERLPAAGSSKSILLYKRGGEQDVIDAKAGKQQQGGDNDEKSQQRNDERREPRDDIRRPSDEHGHQDDASDSSHTVAEHTNSRDSAGVAADKKGSKGEKGKEDGEGDDGDDIGDAKAVFTWKDLNYTVGNNIQLLNNVSGYCKAGELTALMGSSGAGKTTLMDVLAGRKDQGEIKGEVLFEGKPLPISFIRTNGYCLQQDVHTASATVLEALRFSARLRQPRTTDDAEVYGYVDEIIDLLDLHDIKNALIGVPGAGLGIEQRKRLTIAVELVAKPSILFLDEPTSGLDGQSSFIIVSFLKKLVATGQAVLCTIHQPSASLFAEFDTVLLMQNGGRTAYFGKVDALPDYFGQHGAKIPKGANNAEAMIDILQGALGPKDVNWADKWAESDENKRSMELLEKLKEASSKQDTQHEGDGDEYASTIWTQMRLVTKRASVQLWRSPEYVQAKVALHVFSALFNGFSFWMIGNSYGDLQLRLFTVFQLIFVAPGVLAQMQPRFVESRKQWEGREKKAKVFSWWAFIIGEVISELPYLVVCAFLYWVCWYPVVGFSLRANIVGPVFFEMVLYELLYTGIGQAIAAYAPSAVFAALVNPIVISFLTMMCGVLIPFEAMQTFWRYWAYYLDPFNYLMGALLVPVMWAEEVNCRPEEMAIFDPPSGSTCGGYLQTYAQSDAPGYLFNPAATTGCMWCPASRGADYLEQRNLGHYVYGWRDICITLLFVVSSYTLAFILMKTRTKQAKSAS